MPQHGVIIGNALNILSVKFMEHDNGTEIINILRFILPFINLT